MDLLIGKLCISPFYHCSKDWDERGRALMLFSLIGSEKDLVRSIKGGWRQEEGFEFYGEIEYGM